jgi:acyl dehydratase
MDSAAVALGTTSGPVAAYVDPGEARGPSAPDHTFSEAARSRPVGRVTLPTTPDQTFRYAGASGDRSPLHVSDEAARQSGFPRKFNQGLLTLGLVAKGLVELAAAGEPDRVAPVATRFAAPAFPGGPIELAVYDAGDGACAFEPTRPGPPC